MRKLTKSNLPEKLVFTAALIIISLFSFAPRIFAQDDATRRLYVALIGYELNQAAAKDALAAGAKINWQNDAMSGETMLIMAIKGFKDAKVIKFLLDHGADADLKDETGKTALEWARQYNIGRDRNGREILQLLEGASGQANPADQSEKETKPAGTAQNTPSKTIPNKTATATPKTTRKSEAGAPSADEVIETMEKSFTGIYQNHFYGVKNKVTFEWTGGITIGAIQTIRAAPKPCYPVKLKVTVTAEDPRDGNRSSVTRGSDATTGNYTNEIFCFYRDGFGEWDYGTYGK